MEPIQLLKFKSSVLAQQCESIGEQILNYQKYIDPIGLIKSNRGGWQSRFDMSSGVAGFPFFDDWSDCFFQLVHLYYIDYVEKFYNRRIKENPIEQRWIIRAWFNINWTGDWNHEHRHLSNVPDVDEFYYVPVEMRNDREFWLPYSSGTFYITDSHNTFFVCKSLIGTTEEKDRKYIDFKAGDFWIANSNLVHGVSENKQKDPRISMSFNIEPIVDRELK